MGPYAALKPKFGSVPQFVIEWLENLQRFNRISMVNQPNVSKFCDQAFSELRSSFPIIPKDLAKWKCFTHWKNLIFSENQFWSFCETILMKMDVFFWNRWAESEIVSQKDQNWFLEKIKFFQYVKHFHFAKSFGILRKVDRSCEKGLAEFLVVYHWNPM